MTMAMSLIKAHSKTPFKARPGVVLLCCWLVVMATGCGKPVTGVYVYQRDYTVYGVGFTKISTFDLRSDGTFRFEFDPGRPAKNIIPGSREVVEGKWQGSGGNITCYNGDGSEFSHLKQEGGDLINDQGMRYSRD